MQISLRQRLVTHLILVVSGAVCICSGVSVGAHIYDGPPWGAEWAYVQDYADGYLGAVSAMVEQAHEDMRAAAEGQSVKLMAVT